jgi:hypothetical protein
MSKIHAGMKVIGADGVPVRIVDGIEGRRIRLKTADSGQGSHKGHHHYIDEGLVADVEGNSVRLSANAVVAVTFEEEK